MGKTENQGSWRTEENCAAAVHSEGAQPDKEHGRNEEQIDRLQSLMGKLRNIVIIQLTMR